MTEVRVEVPRADRAAVDLVAGHVASAGSWPLVVERRGLRRRAELSLAEHDGDVHVLDPAARTRVAGTLGELARVFESVTVRVDGGGVQLSGGHHEVADRVAEEGLRPGLTYRLQLEDTGRLDRLPEPGVAGEQAVDAAWERIERWLDEHHPRGTAVLAPGASDDALRALEEAIGRPLPAPLRRSLARHDGQGDGVATITEGHELLAAALIADEWRMLDAIAEDVDAHDGWWRPAWIPFTADGSGNGLCLDADTGEVIFRDHEDTGELETRSYEGWLTRWADELEAGVQVLDDDGDVDLRSD